MSRATRASLAVLAACTIAHFSNHLYTGSLSPFMPIIRDELSLSLTEVGLVTSAAVFAMTASHLLVGYLSDKGWRDILIPASILFTALVVLLTSLTTTLAFLILCQVLLGLAASAYHPCAFPALTERFPGSSRATAAGIQAAGGLVGMAVVPALGVTLFVLLGGWKQSLVVLGMMGFALFAAAAMLMGRGRGEPRVCEDSTWRGPEVEGWTRNYALILILSGLRGIPFRCVAMLMPVYLVDRFGYTPVWAGSLTTIMLMGGLVGEVVSAPLSDRLRRRVPFIVLSNAVTTPCLLLLNTSIDQTLVIAVLVFFGFFYFLGVPPNEAFETEVSPARSRGLAFGLLFSIGALPGAVAPLVFGSLGDVYGLSASILFLASTMALAGIISLFLRENRLKVSPSTPVEEDLPSGTADE